MPASITVAPGVAQEMRTHYRISGEKAPAVLLWQVIWVYLPWSSLLMIIPYQLTFILGLCPHSYSNIFGVQLHCSYGYHTDKDE